MNLARCDDDISLPRPRARELRRYFAEMAAAHGWYSYHVLTPEYA